MSVKRPSKLSPELARLALAPFAVSATFVGHFAELLTTSPKRLKAAGSTSSPRRSRAVPAAVGLFGLLFPHANILTELGYGTALDQFGADIRQLADDDDVSEIVIVVDSPGGSVFGTQEAADAVYAARQVKPVTAIANSEAASAAYWIASQASELVVTDGGQVGSIGVYQLHTDVSQALAKTGKTVSLVSAGERKTAGHPYGPLDPVGREEIQKMVTGYYDMFVKAVARGRKTTPGAVRNGFGRGGMEIADRAVNSGMADRVLSFDKLVNEKVGGPSSGRSSSAGRASASDQDDAIESRRRKLNSDSPMKQAAAVYERRRQLATSPRAKPGPVTPCPTRDAILWGSSLHEAAHAVVAVALRVPFSLIHVVPQSHALGELWWKPEAAHDEALATVLYAGVFGEQLSELKRRTDDPGRRDREMVATYCPDGVKQRRAYMAAEAIIENHKAAVRLIATKLLASPTRTLSSEQVEAYAREAGLC